MLYPLVGAAGTGKTTYIIKKIKDLATKGEKVLLLVPEQFSFEMERRVLLEVGAQAVGLVEVKSFSHFCRKVFMDFGGGAGQRLSEAAKVMLMHVTLDSVRDKLEQYGRAAAKPGFVSSALEIVEQFKYAGIKPEELQKFSLLTEDERLKKKTTELYEIYAIYQAYLENGFIDDKEDLSRCVDILRGKNYFKDLYVFLDSFRDFTPAEREMVGIMMDSCKAIYLSILSNNIEIKGKNQDSCERETFKIVKENALHIISDAKSRNMPVAAPIHFEKAFRFHSEELKWLAEALVQTRPEPLRTNGENLVIYQAADPYEELRFAAAKIAQLVRNEGYRFRDFTIIVRSLDRYQTCLEQMFRRYQIPLFWDNRMDIRHVTVIRAVLEALDAVQSKFDTAHVLALAKSPVMGLEQTAVLELENYCYTWNIQKEQWLHPMVNNPKGMVSGLSDEDQAALDRINQAASSVLWPLLHLRDAMEDADGLRFASGVYAFLEEIGAREHLKAAFGTESLLYEQILQQNNEAWDALMDLLDTMAGLLKGHVLPLEQLLELFRMGIEVSDFGAIPNTLDQVTVGTADRIRPNEPKVVFVLGMNQGEFPPLLKEQPFFTDGEREKLLESGIQIGPTVVRQNDYEQLYLYSALTAASDKLFLTCHLAQLDGAESAPSPLLNQILSLTGEKTLLKREQLGELFFTANEDTVFDALCRQYQKDDPFVSALYQHVKDGDHGEKLEKVERVLQRQDFAIEEETLAQELFGTFMHLSPTNVNKYFSCPFAYFCYSGLHLRARKRADYSSLEAGNLLHHLLAQMVIRHGGKGLHQLSLSQMEKEAGEIVEEYLRDCVGDTEKLQQRSRYLFRNLAHRAAYILKQLGEEFSQSQFEPLFCELPIRKGSPVPPVVFETERGIRLSIEGIVDRVDVMEKNGRRYARVIDYKSSVQSFSFTEMYYGLKLQMLLYLLSICENGSGKLENAVPAGVLYFPAQDASFRVPRNTGGETVQQQRRKNYKMSGLVLEDEDCIFGMEQPVLKKTKSKKGQIEQKMVLGNYIPVKSTANGYHAAQSRLVNEQQMKLIFKHIRGLMTEMADHLSRGQIEALPVGSKSEQPCTYCEFRSICQHQDSDKKTIFDSMKKEECFEELEKRYAGDGGEE
ncbi:MAG: PD-(D/E)XK nuclease family protein [Negativibacillus sp.]